MEELKRCREEGTVDLSSVSASWEVELHNSDNESKGCDAKAERVELNGHGKNGFGAQGRCVYRVERIAEMV